MRDSDPQDPVDPSQRERDALDRDAAPRLERSSAGAPEPDAPAARAGGGDASVAALAWVLFFCILSSYYVLRPIRDAFGIARGVQNLKWLYLGTFAATLVLSPCFSALATRMRPRALVPLAFHFFAFQLLVFYGLLRWLGEEGRFHAGNVFFVWTSVFNLFVVSVFWSFMADLHRPGEARRRFGLIASGGSAGGFCGALLTEQLVERVGPAVLLLVSVALLELAVPCARLLRRRAGPEPPRAPASAAPLTPGFLQGAVLLLRSRYLLGICAYMLLTTICASIVYYQRGAIVSEAMPNVAGRARLFATMDTWAQLGIFALQVLAVGPLLGRLGAARTLCILPSLYVAGFLALGLEGSLAVIVGFEIARRVAGYGVAAPAREFLFTFVTPEEKYKSKNFIDTAAWRGGDVAGNFLADAVAAAGARLSLLALAALPICILWTAVGARIGRSADRSAPPPAAGRRRGRTGTDGEASHRPPGH